MLGKIVSVDGIVGLVIKDMPGGKVLVQIFDGTVGVKIEEYDTKSLHGFDDKASSPLALAPEHQEKKGGK